MDETAWLSSSEWLSLWGHVELTDRKRQLLAVAVCRSFADLLADARSVRMMEFTEAWADLEASKSNEPAYASAWLRYCGLLYESSEYARDGQLSSKVNTADEVPKKARSAAP